MSVTIHPTAVVHRATRIHESVTIGPYAVIEDGVELGNGVTVAAHAIVRAGSVLGEHCHVDSQAVIGGLPQDLRFDARTPSGVRLGPRVQVREGATIHRATEEGRFTEVGEGVFLMANAHVGHDSRVGRHAVLANNVMLGGFVAVGEHAFLGGAVGIHQHVRIGESSMIGGGARITRDVPPFTLSAERNELSGLNLIGLRRRQFTPEAIRALKLAYRFVCGDGGSMRSRATLYAEEPRELDAAVVRFLEFFASGQRGFIQPLSRRFSGNGEA